MKKLIAFLLVVIVLMMGSCMSHIAQAEAPTLTLKILREREDGEPGTIKTMIYFVSQEYDCNADTVIGLVGKESSFRVDVYGDSNKAFGLGQFHKSTGEYFQNKYKRYDLKIDNPVNQIEMICLALKDKQFKHGTPFSTYKNHPPL